MAPDPGKQLRRPEPDQINANVSIEQERHGKAFFRFWCFGCWRSAMKSGENLLRLLIKESQDRFHLCWPPSSAGRAQSVLPGYGAFAVPIQSFTSKSRIPITP